METGDVLGTGTISGPNQGENGSLIEITWGGKNPITLATTGEQRTFLQDGDTLVLRGWCDGGSYRIGFGECSGSVTPALPENYFTQ